MPNVKPSFSANVAARVLKDRGLDGQVSADELAEAAKSHDLHNEGYVSRDELELAAGDLARQLGLPDGDETRGGFTYPRGVLDDAKARLNAIGVHVTDSQMRRALERIDDGDAVASEVEVTAAAAALVEVARLERLPHVQAPPRPAVVAEADGAVPDLGRRKLADTFSYAGNGPVKVAFLDADSTLRVSSSGSVSANGPTDVRLLPFVADRLKELADDGYLIAIVSNQAGVQYGHVTMETADSALMHTVDLIRAAGAEVHYVDYAESNGPDRKPNPGMAERLDAMLRDTFGPDAAIDKATSMMVGDSAYKRGHDTRPDGSPGTNFSSSDRRFAEGWGVPFVEPQEAFGWQDYGVPQFDNKDHLDAFMERFRIGHRASDGPLLARFRHD
jgi:DNA 3'-phosphatase